MIHLEMPIARLEIWLEGLYREKEIAEKRERGEKVPGGVISDILHLTKSIHQYEKAINILKRASEDRK